VPISLAAVVIVAGVVLAFDIDPLRTAGG